MEITMMIEKKQPKPVLFSEEYETEYRIENGRAEFVKYTGCQEEYEVPAKLDGCPVTEIGKYAFAEHRNLTCVKLPPDIRQLGAHCFYNCRSLSRLEFGDQMDEIADGAFKNCDSLKYLILRTKPGRRLNLKNILMDTAEGVRVTIFYEKEAGQERAELIFPPYLVEYAENTPGRVLEKQAYGSGERYRHCLYDGQLNFEQYDHLLDFSVAMDQPAYPIQCAVGRLMYPYELKEASWKQYEHFLKSSMDQVLSFYIKREDEEVLRWLLEGKWLDRENLEAAIELCRTCGKHGLLPQLMEYQNQSFQAEKKRYEL